MLSFVGSSVEDLNTGSGLALHVLPDKKKKQRALL